MSTSPSNSPAEAEQIDAQDTAAPARRYPPESRSIFGSIMGVFSGAGQMILETGPVAGSLRGLGRGFQAMEHVDFRLIWIGTLCSNLGMWMQTVAVQWLVKSIAGDTSALWLGRTAFFQQVPTALLLPVGGMLADRLDRRWIILVGNIFLAILAALLAIIQWQQRMTMWMLMLSVAVLGMWQAMLRPAYQSLLTTLVSRQNLPNAVALSSMQNNLTRGIGPAIAGVILVWFGAHWSFGINAITYLAIIFALMSLRKPPPTSNGKREGLLRSLAGGSLYLRHRPDLQLVLMIVLTSSFLATPLLFMLPAIVQDMYDDRPQQFSSLLSCFGFGAVVGVTMLAMRSHRPASPWRGLITMGIMGMVQVVFSFQWRFEIAMLLMFIAGMAYIGSLNRFVAAIVGSIPNHVRGRVASMHMLCMMTGYPTGSLIAGSVASMHGMVFLLRLYGCAMVVILLLTALLIRLTNMHFKDESELTPEQA